MRFLIASAHHPDTMRVDFHQTPDREAR